MPAGTSSERWLFAGLLLTLGLIGSGGFYFHYTEQQLLRQQAGEQLHVIGELKARQIANWRQERLADGQMLAADNELARAVARQLLAEQWEPDLHKRLQALRVYYRFAGVGLVDSAGRLRLHIGDVGPALPPRTAISDQPYLLESGSRGQAMAVTLVVPLPGIGALVLPIDLSVFVDPLLRNWPVPSRTASAWLVRPDGERLVLLRAPKADVEEMPLSVFASPAAAVDIADTHGTPYLATLQSIRGSDWQLIARIEQAEALGKRRDSLPLIAAVTLGLFLVAGAGFGLIYQSRGVRRYRAQLAAEAARRAEQRRFQTAFEASPLAGSIARAADGMFVDANDNFVRVFGWSRAEMVGRTTLDLGVWLDPGARRAFVAELQKTGRVLSHETRWRGRNGRRHAIELSAALIDIDDVPHIIAFASDIGERRKAQAELSRYRRRLESMVGERTRQLALARDEAEHANQTKSAFLANMSHEIRTPLNAIIGLTHIIRRDTSDPQLRQRLERVGDSARHLLGLINDILDVAKIEAGRLNLNACDFATAPMFAEALEMIVERATEKGLQLETDISPDLPPWLYGDPLRLQQILINFLSNAVKFTGQGRITLRAEVAERLPDGILLRCSVADTGIGIAPDVLPRLFKAFEQADNSTTRRFGGSGLGLAISRQLARLMGGDIEVDSQPGCGSTFRVTVRFGLGAPGAGADEEMQEIPPIDSRARVLLVEDDPLNCEVALDLLDGLGLGADVASNGQIAVDMAAETTYDLILMDMQMPVMDGLEATRRILALPGREKTRIVAMTANVFAENRAASLAAGMVEHLSKPVDPQQLHRCLARWLPTAEAVAETPAAAVPSGGAQEATATPAAEGDLLTALAADGGFDWESGLAALGGKVDKYAILLRKYVEVHNGTVEVVGRTLPTGDPVMARRLVHTLKGTTATLGLAATSIAAAELERVLDAGAEPAEIDACLATLGKVHGRQLDVLRRALVP